MLGFRKLVLGEKRRQGGCQVGRFLPQNTGRLSITEERFGVFHLFVWLLFFFFGG